MPDRLTCRLLLAAAAAVVVLGGCAPRPSVAEASPAPSAALPSPAATAPTTAMEDLFARAGFDVPSQAIRSTDFSLTTLDGKKVSLSSYRGKVVVLSFWATWCAPCKEEMPAMEALYRDIRARGFEILAVDAMEERATVEKFVKQYGYTFPVLLDTKGDVSGLYGAQALPTNYIIDSDGSVRARVVGIGGPKWTSPEMRAVFDHLLSP